MDTKSFFEAVGRSFEQVIKPGNSLLAAVSGGSDSTALLHLLYHFKRRLEIGRIVIAHVNHGLRGAESDADQALVEQTAAKLGFECFTTRLSPPAGNKKGLEDWGRTCRYGFFAGLKAEHKLSLIATAHTFDDQAETVLMRLMRGTSLAGLRGILPVRADSVVRPLLDIRHADLRDWLTARHIPFCIDSSNQDTAFTRNWVRLVLLPGLRQINPGVDTLLVQIGVIGLRHGQQSDEMSAQWVRRFVTLLPDLSCTIKKEGFADEAAASDGLAFLFNSLEIEPSQVQIQKIIQSARKNSGQILLPGNWRVFPHNDHITLLKQVSGESAAVFACTLAIPGTASCTEAKKTFTTELLEPGADFFKKNKELISKDNLIVHLNADSLSTLTFRSPADHDKFWPLGAKAPMNLRSYFKNQKIPREKRDSLGVVVTEKNEIAWVPGLQIGHNFRISEKTTRIIKVSCSASFTP
jgi:tRNA(Ile)-lysidine synthase